MLNEMAGGQYSVKKIKIAERRLLAVEIRKGGASYRAIADAIRAEIQSIEDVIASEDGREPKKIRYSRSQAHRDVKAAVDSVREKTSESAEQLVEIFRQRYEDIISAYWEDSIMGDTEKTKLILKAMGDEAQLLNLYRLNIELTGHSGGPVEVNPFAGMQPDHLEIAISNMLLAMPDNERIALTAHGVSAIAAGKKVLEGVKDDR